MAPGSEWTMIRSVAKALKIEPWLDSPVGSAATDAKATYYGYTPVDPQDSPLEYDRRVRTKTIKILGETTKKTFYAYFTNGSGEYVEIEEMAASPTATYGASLNLRLTKTHYPGTDAEVTAGRLKTKSIRTVVSTATLMSVYPTIPSPPSRMVLKHLRVANKTTRKVITIDPKGNETRRGYIYTGSAYELVETMSRTLTSVVRSRSVAAMAACSTPRPTRMLSKFLKQTSRVLPLSTLMILAIASRPAPKLALQIRLKS